MNFASARQVSLPTLNFLIGVFTASYRILDAMQQATSPQTAGAVPAMRGDWPRFVMAPSGDDRHRHRAARPPSGLRKAAGTRLHGAGVAGGMLLTGAGYWWARRAGWHHHSSALTPEDPRSSGNNMNILLIGLDSRKDQDGNDLPWSILKQLHAGRLRRRRLQHQHPDTRARRSRRQVVAFSIPRDDWVSFNGVPGYNHIKIKEAYGLTKQYVAQKLVNQGGTPKKNSRPRPAKPAGRRPYARCAA